MAIAGVITSFRNGEAAVAVDASVVEIAEAAVEIVVVSIVIASGTITKQDGATAFEVFPVSFCEAGGMMRVACYHIKSIPKSFVEFCGEFIFHVIFFPINFSRVLCFLQVFPNAFDTLFVQGGPWYVVQHISLCCIIWPFKAFEFEWFPFC